MLNNYYEEGLALNPIQATMTGDNRYNDYFFNPLADENIQKFKTYYIRYRQELIGFDDASLSENEKMTKAILLWECDMNLKGYTFKKEYFPIDQMWSINLTIGQLAGGSSAQPFKTEIDSISAGFKSRERLE